jgi:hypothetical protein
VRETAPAVFATAECRPDGLLAVPPARYLAPDAPSAAGAVGAALLGQADAAA